MRCLLCERFSLSLLCRACQESLLKPTLSKRILDDGFLVYSFYGYEEIAPLLLTKHTYIGAAIYKILAKNSFTLFAKEFSMKAYGVGVDDVMTNGYAHTAILARSLKSENITPIYNTLRAKNRVNYSGKSLSFRLENPRDFVYTGPKGEIILVDDIITTGTTLKEAYKVCQKRGANPLFALTLADARR